MERIPKSLFDTIRDRIPDIADELSALPNLGSAAGGAAAGAAGSLGATIASMGIAIGLEQVLEIAVTAIENWINRVEIARERSSKIMEEYDQRNNTNADRKKTVWQFADRYDELSKGVDLSTNKNNALTSEEYAEFLNINTQLAKSFPELIKGIDDNGNSILKLGAKGTTAKKQLKELLQTEEELNNFKIANDLEESFDGVYTYIEDGNNAAEELENAKKQSGVLPNFVEHGVQLEKNNYRLFGGDITDNERTDYAYAMQSTAQDFMNGLDENRRIELENMGINASELFSMERNDSTGSFELYANLYSLTPDEIEKLQKAVNDNVANLNGPLIDQFGNQKMELEQQIEKGKSAWTDFVPQIVSGMKSEQTFKNLKNPDLQNMAIQIVESLDSSYANAMDQYDPDPYAWVRDKLILPMSKLDDADKKLLTTNFQDLFNLNLEDMNVDDARTNIQYYCTAIAKLLNKSLPEVQKLLGFDEFFQTASKYDQTVAYASGGTYKSAKDVENSKGFNQQDVIEAMDKNSINTDEEIDKFKEFLEISNSLDEAVKAYKNAPKETDTTPLTFDEAWNSIGTSGNEETDARALETKERLLELAEAGKLTEKELSESSLAHIFTDAGISIEEATQKINNMKSSADQLTSMETGISSISEILSQKQKNLSGKDTHLKGIDISQLSAMPEDVKAQKKEYEHFVEVLSTGTSKMDKCRNAADNLATAYLNSGNFLAKLTEENKDYYTSVLSQMGIENAAQVVTNTLSRQKINARISTFNLKTATKQEINSLGNYVASLKGSRKALAYYTLQQQLANKNSLKTSGSIKNLKALAKQCGITGEAIDLMKSLAKDKKDLKQYTTGKKKNDRYAGENISKIKTEIKGKTKRLKKITKEGAEVQPEINFDSPSDPGSGTKDSPESKQQFDWISRALNRLSSQLDLVKAKYDNLFSNKKAKDSNSLLKLQNKNLDDQYKILNKTEKYQRKAQKKYTKKANKVHISKNKKEDNALKKAVENGRIKGDMNDLIAEYGEEKAKKIQEYQDWYDKAKEAEKNKENTTKLKQENRIQKYQGKVNNADKKKSLAEAQKENATTAEAKNKYVDNEKKYIRTSYNNQIKIARREKDSLKVKQLKEEKKKELRNLNIEKHQNLADEHQSELDRYSAEKQNLKTAGEKNAVIDLEKASTSNLYNEKIKIAELEGKISEQKQLQAEKEKALRDLDMEKHQNLADQHQAELDRYSAEKQNLKTANEKNSVIDQEKNITAQLYNEKIQIAKLEGNQSEELRLQAELSQRLVSLEKEKFDNIVQYYNNLRKVNENHSKKLSNSVDELEARGLIVTSSLYSSQMAQNNDKKRNFQEELSALKQQHDKIEKGTQAWYDSLDSIQACEDGIAGCIRNSIELGNAIRNIDWQIFEKFSARADLLSSEYDLGIKFMSNKKMFDDKSGNFTKEGTATLGANYSKMLLAKNKKEEAWNILETTKKHIDNGDPGYTDPKVLEEYNAKYKEYIQLSEAEFDIQKNLIDMMKEKYQKELDCLQDIINKRKDLLQTEKDAYDYQKNIEEKTKNIAVITKQLSALGGDDSEEAKTRIQQLQISLDEANKDLQDTEYQQWITDHQTMLDNLYNEYSQFIDTKLNDTDALLDEAIAYLSDIDIAESVSESLQEYYDNNGYNPTDDFNAINTALGENGSIVKSIQGAVDSITKYLKTQQTYQKEADKVTAAVSEIGNVFEDANAITRYEEAQKAYDSLAAAGENGENIQGYVSSSAVSTLDSTGKDVQMIYNSVSQVRNAINSIGNIDSREGFSEDNGRFIKEAYDLYNSLSTSGKQLLGDDYKNLLDNKQSQYNHWDNVIKNEAAETERRAQEAAAEQDRQNKRDAIKNWIAGQKANKAWWIKQKYENSTPAQKYIHDKIFDPGSGARYLNNTGLNQLGSYLNTLGIPGGYLLDRLTSLGFSQGGIVDTLQKIPGMNGDDGWATLKRGEAVLTPEQTAAFQKLLQNLDVVNPAVDLYKNMKNVDAAPDCMISQSTGDINIDMSFPGVTNYEEFRQKLQSDPKIENMFKSMIWNKGSLSKYNTKM